MKSAKAFGNNKKWDSEPRTKTQRWEPGPQTTNYLLSYQVISIIGVSDNEACESLRK